MGKDCEENWGKLVKFIKDAGSKYDDYSSFVALGLWIKKKIFLFTWQTDL